MTKFLRQKAVVRKAIRDSSGEIILNEYGDPQYSKTTQTVKCRRERSTKDVLSTAGAISKSTTIYYFYNSILLDVGDLIDDKPVLTIKDFVNDKGYSEGWEAQV